MIRSCDQSADRLVREGVRYRETYSADTGPCAAAVDVQLESADTGLSLRSLNELSFMNIQEARPSDVPMIAAVLQEADEWLAGDSRVLWSSAEISHERVLRDVSSGLFHVARQGEHVAGVMKFELEDAHFWPEVRPGTSAFVHKLAVRRAWAKKGVSTELLSYARTRTQELGRAYLRLDCVADRHGLRSLYESFGFELHSVVRIGATSFSRYQLLTATLEGSRRCRPVKVGHNPTFDGDGR